MQPDIWQTLQAWVLALLLYPGLLYAALVVLVGEWLVGTLRPLFVQRLYRAQATARLYSLLQPLYIFLKLLGRQEAVRWQRPDDEPAAPSHPGESLLAVIGALAPLLALLLLPVGGSPLVRQLGPIGDLILLLPLLAVQPITHAVLRLREGGMPTLAGTRSLGRLLAGLFPTLLIAAALVEVSGTGTLDLAGLTAAPIAPQQTLVRLLAAIALLVALPWWIGGQTEEGSSAGAYAGRLLQGVALSASWAMLVLPVPGELPWAIILFIGGTLFAYVGMRVIAERWSPARRPSEGANLLWVTALPVAAAALVLALWTST